MQPHTCDQATLINYITWALTTTEWSWRLLCFYQLNVCNRMADSVNSDDTIWSDSFKWSRMMFLQLLAWNDSEWKKDLWMIVFLSTGKKSDDIHIFQIIVIFSITTNCTEFLCQIWFIWTDHIYIFQWKDRKENLRNICIIHLLLRGKNLAFRLLSLFMLDLYRP